MLKESKLNLRVGGKEYTAYYTEILVPEFSKKGRTCSYCGRKSTMITKPEITLDKVEKDYQPIRNTREREVVLKVLKRKLRSRKNICSKSKCVDEHLEKQDDN